MLEEMKTKSETLKKEADEIYSKASASCETTIKTKKDELENLGLDITKLNADI